MAKSFMGKMIEDWNEAEHSNLEKVIAIKNMKSIKISLFNFC